MLHDRVDFFTAYLQYTDSSESPKFFNRWSAIASLGALLGRQFFIRFGHDTLYPNVYCMLIGSPGTRKSTAIKTVKKALQATGYTTLAAEKTTKEKFLLDLSGEGGDDSPEATENMLDKNLWGSDTAEDSSAVREVFIAADEFNDFFGNGNLEFISLLGTLWDYSGIYRNRIKNGKSVSIPNPTISILGGNTPTGFSIAFPPEVIGQGFFSRLILVYGEPSGKKIAFPEPPSAESTAAIHQWLTTIKRTVVGEATLQPEARTLLEKIYITWPGFEDDVRFESYGNRRFTHLLKLCLIHAASRLSAVVAVEDVVAANTVLTHTEHLMPRALGEFGKAKHSDVAHKILQYLNAADGVVGIKELWKVVHTDLEKITDLANILQNLAQADKVMPAETHKKNGYLAKKRPLAEISSDTLCYDYLTREEKELKR